MTAETMPLAAPLEGVEDFAASDAEGLLDMLSPRHALWRDDPTAWIFRGQGDARWTLKAKAVRDMASFAHFGIRRTSRHPEEEPANSPAWSLRSDLVHEMLEAFLAKLDRAGIVIPTRSPRVRSDHGETSSNAEPSRELFPLMALAQHHGLPTPLLDWSRRAWVGAYFAALDCSNGHAPGATACAVWGLEKGDLREPIEGPMFYEAPASTNPNLHAQDGLFTMLRAADDDLSLDEHWARVRRTTGRTPKLRRLLLPAHAAPRLLRLLSYEGITGSSMFPGPDGAVRAMAERALWDDWLKP